MGASSDFLSLKLTRRRCYVSCEKGSQLEINIHGINKTIRFVRDAWLNSLNIDFICFLILIKEMAVEKRVNKFQLAAAALLKSTIHRSNTRRVTTLLKVFKRYRVVALFRKACVIFPMFLFLCFSVSFVISFYI